MIDLKRQWQSGTDRERWAARGASFVAKVKATKLVWFPPKPVETSKKAASTAKRATKKAAKKATAKSPAKSTTAKSRTDRAKNPTSRLRKKAS